MPRNSSVSGTSVTPIAVERSFGGIVHRLRGPIIRTTISEVDECACDKQRH
jgi:hypothetical protein